MGTFNVNLYSPHKKQEQLHRYCDLSSPNFWTICCAGRQSGKSKAAQQQVLYWALKDPNSIIWIISPTESQAIKMQRDIVACLGNTPLIKSKTASKGAIEIGLSNGSLIQFKSASSENSLRGASVNYLVIDEAAFIKKSTFEEIIVPTLTAAGKKCLLISTPKGKNLFWELYLRGLDAKQTQYKSIKFTSNDSPYANKDLIESFRSSLPTAIFQQEFEAEFVDSASVFRNIDEISLLQLQKEPIGNSTYYAGIDIGMITDNTVITILNQDGDMVYYDAFTGIEAPEIKDRLVKILKKWKPINTLMEENNQGLPILQLVEREYNNINGFITTNESKGTIINQLIAAFSGKEIKIINDDQLKLELQGFIFEMSPSGKVRYTAGSGFHDDMVISLALAWHSYVNNKIGSRYAVVSENNINVAFGGKKDVTQNLYTIVGNINQTINLDGDNY